MSFSSSFFLSLLHFISSSKPFYLLIPVDEYILMAKEKHGYNMEQVGNAAIIKMHQIHHLSLFSAPVCLFSDFSLTLSSVPVCPLRLWACCYGTNTTWSARWPTSPTSPPSQMSGPWRIKSCSSRPSASTARASTASSRW